MFSGDLGKILITLFLLFFTTLSFAKLADITDAPGMKSLATKLNRVGADLEMKEGTYRESMTGGGKQVNANDKNSFMSSTTYHSYVWDYCLKWVGVRQCDEWLPAYISRHGQDSDRSPAEGVAFSAWAENRQKSGQGDGKNYGIWNIEAGGGSPFKFDGTLDRERLTKWSIKDEVRGKLAKVGQETAARVVSKVFDYGEARDGSVMPNMESLRMMAGRWSKMFRNRLLSNIGDIRAMQPGIEVAQGEDIADCSEYLNELRKNMDRSKLEERIDPQNLLAIETRNQQIQDRLKMCQQAKQMSAYAPNVKAQGNEVKARGPKGEWIDGALSRANLMAVDYVGIDPSQAGIDERIKLEDTDVRAQVTLWEKGGRKSQKVWMTNAEQLRGYNRQLASAENGFEEVAARTNRLKAQKGLAAKYAIAPGTMNAVKLNDLTPAMIKDAREGGYQGDVVENHPGDRLETKPAQLVVKKN